MAGRMGGRHTYGCSRGRARQTDRPDLNALCGGRAKRNQLDAQDARLQLHKHVRVRACVRMCLPVRVRMRGACAAAYGLSAFVCACACVLAAVHVLHVLS
jgi:hypothetical protein